MSHAGAVAARMPQPQSPAPVPLLRRMAKAAVLAADALWSALAPRWVLEEPALVVMGLHSLCASRAALHDPALAPHQNVCVADFRTLVRAVLDSGCTIVSPAQVAAGLEPGRTYVMLTFDDGYYNNVLALPVLKEFGVPAAFFVTSSNVLQGKCFWWDALARELLYAGAPRQVLAAETRRLKRLPARRIEAFVRARFGDAALRPRGDSDRPFTPAELAEFARHPLVHIGNHTADHQILTTCGPDEVRRQIEGCQSALQAITGSAPVAIAYPNGNHSPAVLDAARAAGLRVGLTVDPGRNRVPAGAAALRLARFYFHGHPDPAREFRACRTGFVPSRILCRALAPA